MKSKRQTPVILNCDTLGAIQKQKGGTQLDFRYLQHPQLLNHMSS